MGVVHGRYVQRFSQVSSVLQILFVTCSCHKTFVKGMRMGADFVKLISL